MKPFKSEDELKGYLESVFFPKYFDTYRYDKYHWCFDQKWHVLKCKTKEVNIGGGRIDYYGVKDGKPTFVEVKNVNPRKCGNQILNRYHSELKYNVIPYTLRNEFDHFCDQLEYWSTYVEYIDWWQTEESLFDIWLSMFPNKMKLICPDTDEQMIKSCAMRDIEIIYIEDICNQYGG